MSSNPVTGFDFRFRGWLREEERARYCDHDPADDCRMDFVPLHYPQSDDSPIRQSGTEASDAKERLVLYHILKQNSRSDQMIMGPGILGFGLRYPPNLIDDFRLGFLSGKTPDWIVVNDFYTSWFLELRAVEQDAYHFVRMRLDNEFKPVYNQAGFVIYRKR